MAGIIHVINACECPLTKVSINANTPVFPKSIEKAGKTMRKMPFLAFLFENFKKRHFTPYLKSYNHNRIN